jgi:hypothetical protein
MNRLIPELDVSDLGQSLGFYVEVILRFFTDVGQHPCVAGKGAWLRGGVVGGVVKPRQGFVVERVALNSGLGNGLRRQNSG